MNEHPDVTAIKEKANVKWYDKPITYQYLKAIDEVCAANNARLFLFAIPTIDDPQPDFEEDYPDVFKDLPFYCPDDLGTEDYVPWPDGHLNNQGHKKYYEFILETIESQP